MFGHYFIVIFANLDFLKLNSHKNLKIAGKSSDFYIFGFQFISEIHVGRALATGGIYHPSYPLFTPVNL